MATVAQVAKASLQRILVQGSEADFEPDEYQDYIFALNNYMLALDAEGISLGFTEVSDLGDEVTVPVGALRGIIANMAIEVAPDYNGQITPGLQRAAMEGLAVMRKLGQYITPSRFPSTLPIGSGNEGDYSRWDSHFYGCDGEEDILAETTGAIALEVGTLTAESASTPIPAPEPETGPMTILFDIPDDGGSPATLTLPLTEFAEDGVTPMEYDFTVDWGDGSSGTVTAFDDAEATHDYAAIGEYVVSIDGTCERLNFSTLDDRDMLLEVRGWGGIAIKDMSYMFFGCTLMTMPATDAPDTSECASMLYCFANAQAFTDDISGWDFSAVTDMNDFLADINYDTDSYDALLISLSNQTLQPSVELDAPDVSYTISTAQAARDILTGSPNNWTINDNGGI